jgi:hypothetical protein
MVSPTSRFIPINTKLKREHWETLRDVSIPTREKELKSLRYGDAEASLWLMEQISYLKEMLKYNNQFHLDSAGKTL